MIQFVSRFGSPIAVGIYGHAAYELSSFILEVRQQTPYDILSSVDITEEILENDMLQNVQEKNGNNNRLKSGTKVKNNRKTDKLANNLSGIFSLLEIFQLIFL